MSFTLETLASHVNARVIGDASCEIVAVATLENAKAGEISFLTNRVYLRLLKTTKASAVILGPDHAKRCPINALICANPHAAFARIANLLHPQDTFTPMVHSSAQIHASVKIHDSCYVGPYAVIEEGAQIGKRCYIGAHAYVGRNVRIGDGSQCLSNTTIYHEVSIGDGALIHSGAVIGADGFGQAQDDDGHWLKIPQIGSVIIGRDVEIGANTTIDRGAIDDTIIEDGVKLDNQIQIAHNVHVGAHTVIAGATAIAGSTRIGKYCMIGGAVGIVGHLSVADKVTITAMSLVTKSIDKPGKYSSGVPAEENSLWLRHIAHFRQLEVLERRIRGLEKKSGIKE